MIATVTFNPSLDYIVQTPEIIPGATNRAAHSILLAGGKGINVSIVLGNLNVKNRAYGFIGGFTGREIKNQLLKAGCDCDFTELAEGISRVNVKIKSNMETEINAPGPNITSDEYSDLLKKLDCLTESDTLVISGSIPKSVTKEVYNEIIERISPKGCRIIVDTGKNHLTGVLKYKPFLIKPNLDELAEICGESCTNDDGTPCLGTVQKQAGRLMEKGAQNVLVSMGKNGAMLLTGSGKTYLAKAPKGKLVNSVGSGDSMVAGFLSGLEASHGDMEYAFKMGVAAGSASAFSMLLATKKEIFELLDKVTVTPLR